MEDWNIHEFGNEVFIPASISREWRPHDDGIHDGFVIICKVSFHDILRSRNSLRSEGYGRIEYRND